MLRSLLVLLPEAECAAVLALFTRPADIVALVDMCKVAQILNVVIVEILTLACILYTNFDVGVCLPNFRRHFTLQILHK